MCSVFWTTLLIPLISSDNVCLVWGGAACGKQGNCMLYNGQQLRYIFNLTAASKIFKFLANNICRFKKNVTYFLFLAFTFIGGCLDCLVFYFVKDMDLYSEPVPEDEMVVTEKKKDDLSEWVQFIPGKYRLLDIFLTQQYYTTLFLGQFSYKKSQKRC